ncbi:MAG: TetR/AcrR family transcriptional regulator [Pseudomonadales bacterium]|jgi:AcrR family transcriptional regulator|nr:TetR/AcrR family transcriptional regulator [Pseudomonadales bacterium]
MSRAAAKERRRDAIVAAARTLLREAGSAGLAMRALAERAQVSTATPYNLFGSKRAVVNAILDAELERFRAAVARAPGDDLTRLFQAVSCAREIYASDEAFYRALLLAAYGEGGRDYRSLFGGRNHAIWRELVQRAARAGDLKADTDPDALALVLEHLLFSIIIEWALGELPLDELELRAQFGFALVLQGAAAADRGPALAERATALQGRLRGLWHSRGAAARPEPQDGAAVASTADDSS